VYGYCIVVLHATSFPYHLSPSAPAFGRWLVVFFLNPSLRAFPGGRVWFPDLLGQFFPGDLPELEELSKEIEANLRLHE